MPSLSKAGKLWLHPARLEGRHEKISRAAKAGRVLTSVRLRSLIDSSNRCVPAVEPAFERNSRAAVN